MELKGINDNQMTIAAGLSVGLLGKLKKNGKGMSSLNIEKILCSYPDINASWLLTGKGDMLVPNVPLGDTPPQVEEKAVSKDNKNIPYSQTKSEKISSTEDTTAFLAYMREQATAHTKAIKEKDAIIMQQNQQITDLKCQVTRLEGENHHLIDELDRIKMEHPQQSSTPQPGDTSTPQTNSTSSSLSGNTSTVQSDCTPMSHTA